MRLTFDTTTLRRLHPDDLRVFQTYRGDPEVSKFQSWDTMDDVRAQGFLGAMQTMTPLIQPGHWTQIAVADTTTDILLGDMGWHLSADSTEAELGITLACDAQGMGHATRATTLAIAHMFTATPIDCIKIWADVRNTPSRALAERLGFTFAGFEVTDGVKEAAFVMQRPDASALILTLP
ncbi:GNAT family N-acetyltransferase [uncultured Tateyamaria sp.]|uniref:GNAT family N-acetyltransferase n=1 Tax=uncultured Tateyamaria sp. TaxID=455651 RepID=UPI002609E14E|nr:GNAT family N-acetyltransferase [uncultured Tateyamaria sp.]